MESNQQIFNHLIGDITSLKAEIETLKAENETLKAENETLKESVYDPYGSNQTCAEILRHYRDEMDIIQKLEDDDWVLEDIACVSPYIETLKAENEKLKTDRMRVERANGRVNMMLSLMAHYYGYRHLHNPLDPDMEWYDGDLTLGETVGDCPVYDFINGDIEERTNFFTALWVMMEETPCQKRLSKIIIDDDFWLKYAHYPFCF